MIYATIACHPPPTATPTKIVGNFVIIEYNKSATGYSKLFQGSIENNLCYYMVRLLTSDPSKTSHMQYPLIGIWVRGYNITHTFLKTLLFADQFKEKVAKTCRIEKSNVDFST